MATTLIADQSSSVSGLGTSTFVSPIARSFKVDAESTLNPPTGVQIVINKNGSAVATKAISSSTATTTGISAQIACAIGDTITVVLTSAVVNDTILNNVKTSILITTLSF